MTIGQILLQEFLHEANSTRKYIALVPFDKADYKVHEKSMTLKALALHIVEIGGWWKECLVHDELDFAKMDGKPKEINSTQDLLDLHDDLIAKSTEILKNVSDEEFAKTWTMRNGEHVYFSMPKSIVTRTWCMNHLYHHRGQLMVYLRMLNIPVPGIYGPSADEQNM